jgi:hypothetical protein
MQCLSPRPVGEMHVVVLTAQREPCRSGATLTRVRHPKTRARCPLRVIKKPRKGLRKALNTPGAVGRYTPLP